MDSWPSLVNREHRFINPCQYQTIVSAMKQRGLARLREESVFEKCEGLTGEEWEEHCRKGTRWANPGQQDSAQKAAAPPRWAG